MFLIDCYKTRKKLTKKDCKEYYLKQINSIIPITIPDFEIGFIEKQLTPSAYELVDINTSIKRKIKFSLIDHFITLLN